MSDPKEGRATGTVRVGISISISSTLEEEYIIFTPDCDHFAKNDDAKYAVFLPKSTADCPPPHVFNWHDEGMKLELLDDAIKDKLLSTLLMVAAKRTKVEITVNGDYKITALSIPA